MANALITLIVPLWNVSKYLPDFLLGLDEQGRDLMNCEVIFVDDGSTDESANLAEAWLLRAGVRGEVIRKENAGVASARNAALNLVTTPWVSFPDPDDRYGPGFLSNILSEIRSAEKWQDDVSLISANMFFYLESKGRTTGPHPLNFKSKNQAPALVNLLENPKHLKLHANSAFFRTDTIKKVDLRFDSRIVPKFEDGAFTLQYLLQFVSPSIIFVPRARYLYRKRADQSSLSDSSMTLPGAYTEIPKFGWLETLKMAEALLGFVPVWLQYAVLYDMCWMFNAELRLNPPARPFYGAIGDEFMRLAQECLNRIETHLIFSYRITEVSLLTRVILLSLKTDLAIPQPSEINHGPLSLMRLRRKDIPFATLKARRLGNRKTPETKLTYFMTDPMIEVRYQVHGRELSPQHTKIRSFSRFGQTVLYERIAWFDTHLPIEVVINDELRVAPHVEALWAATQSKDFQASRIQRLKKPTSARKSRTSRARLKVKKTGRQLKNVVLGRSPRIRRYRTSLIIRLSKKPIMQSRFHDAWMIMDRHTEAKDNGEAFYRWLRQHQPQINAWFVVKKSSPDWKRLRTEGFKLVAYDSWLHGVLQLNAQFLISSHTDNAINQPTRLAYTRHIKWKFVYLQHGVLKDDLSTFLNSKSIDLFLTSSEIERDAIINDGTRYCFTSREVKTTGAPRTDELLSKSSSVDLRDKNKLLIAPTWRLASKNVPRVELLNSEFFQAWLSIMSSEHLKASAEKSGIEIVFLPHPLLRSRINQEDLPDHVTLAKHSAVDPQDLMARSRAMLTDYSSYAMDAAFAGIPIIYYQFDDATFHTQHTVDKGYFDYEADGFGPVYADSTDVIAATVQALGESFVGDETYRKRAEQFFKFRDPNSSARVFEEIITLRNRLDGIPNPARDSSLDLKDHSWSPNYGLTPQSLAGDPGGVHFITRE